MYLRTTSRNSLCRGVSNDLRSAGTPALCGGVACANVTAAVSHPAATVCRTAGGIRYRALMDFDSRSDIVAHKQTAATARYASLMGR
jgi:hypothetical protein